MYKPTFAMKELGEFKTFEEAFVTLYKCVMESNNLSWQILETATWIEFNGGEPIMFYELKDIAYKVGILGEDGKLIAR